MEKQERLPYQIIYGKKDMADYFKAAMHAINNYGRVRLVGSVPAASKLIELAQYLVRVQVAVVVQSELYVDKMIMIHDRGLIGDKQSSPSREMRITQLEIELHRQ